MYENVTREETMKNNVLCWLLLVVVLRQLRGSLGRRVWVVVAGDTVMRAI